MKEYLKRLITKINKTNTMKPLLVKIIHFINPKYFPNKTYDKLEKWGIEDIVNGKILYLNKQNL